MKSMRLFLLSFALTSCLPATGAETPAAPVVLSADDTEKISAAYGKEITVAGKVHQAFWVRDNVLMITFREEKEGFLAVSFKKHREALDNSFDGDIAKNVKGMRVKITGVVEEYNGRPQIVVKEADQITLED